MTNLNFNELVQELFLFLASEFGCELISSTSDTYGHYVTYKNNFTGVKINHEFRERDVIVELVKLKSGTFPEYPVFFNAKDDLNYANLLDVVAVKDPHHKVQSNLGFLSLFRRNNDLELKRILSLLADAVRQYASEELRGNFSSFERVKALVSKRSSKMD